MSLKFTPPQKLISFCTPGRGGWHRRKADEHQTSSQWLPSQRWGGGGGGGEKKAKWVDSQRCDERERGGRDASSGDINDIDDIDDDDGDDGDDHDDNDNDEQDNDDKVPGASGTRQPGGITPAEREQYFFYLFICIPFLNCFLLHFYLHSFFKQFLSSFYLHSPFLTVLNCQVVDITAKGGGTGRLGQFLFDFFRFLFFSGGVGGSPSLAWSA